MNFDVISDSPEMKNTSTDKPHTLSKKRLD